jgi:phage shock protein PspC (stress-responsive transcriptional regulator)
MKETVKINLNGLLFHLDNDAYECLKNYLDTLKNRFGSTPKEAEEILEDIESRIAEILQEKMSASKQVITLADIEEIISLLGTAEEMGQDEAQETQATFSSGKQQKKTNKRFYRDPQNKILGGVCSGIGAYFNIDPIWIRLIFVFLFFANLAGLLIYVVLLFILPPAHTTAQRLEMQGKRVTLNDIEDSVKIEYEKVKESVKGFSNSNTYNEARGTLSEIAQVIGKILVIFIKVIGIIIGVSLLIALISILLGVVAGGAIFMPWHLFYNWHIPPLFLWQQISLVGICLFLIIGLPILALLVKIFKLLFDIRTTNRVAMGIGATVWLFAVITLIVFFVTDSNKDAFRQKTTSSYTLDFPTAKTLYIDLNTSFLDENDIDYYQVFDFTFGYNDYRNNFLRQPTLKIEQSSDEKTELIIERNSANLKIKKISKETDELVEYNWQLLDTLLLLDEYYYCNEEDAWRMPIINLTLRIPEEQKYRLSPKIEQLMNNEFHSRKRIRQQNWQREESIE